MQCRASTREWGGVVNTKYSTAATRLLTPNCSTKTLPDRKRWTVRLLKKSASKLEAHDNHQYSTDHAH
jgi:hypothetical protein